MKIKTFIEFSQTILVKRSIIVDLNFLIFIFLRSFFDYLKKCFSILI